MPLNKGASRAAISQNIATEVKAGRKPSQAAGNRLQRSAEGWLQGQAQTEGASIRRMNARTRFILRTFSTGMGHPYKDIVMHYQALDTVGKGRFLVAAQKLEQSWQDELRARAEPGFWRRLWARTVARVRAWRLA